MKKPKIEHVSPDGFDTYRWWAPQRLRPGPTWFYATLEHGYHRPGKVELATVDAPLRPLVANMVKYGVPTLPSCAGHFPSDQELWRLYEGLMRDAEWVRSYGLTLKCVETGALDVHRDPSWRLPLYETWATETKKYSGVGRIGLVVCPADAAGICEDLTDIPGVRVEVKAAGDGQGNEIATIITKANDLGHRDQLWGTITHRLTLE